MKRMPNVASRRSRSLRDAKSSLSVFAALAFCAGCASWDGAREARSEQTAASACSPSTVERETCEIEVLALQPTQIAVGFRAVEQRKEKLARLRPEELAEQIKADAAPAVRGPGGRFYMIDRHHFASALARMGVAKMRARLERDLSTLDAAGFRREMEKNGWVHLFDERGRGPRPWRELPRNVAGLKDDPYRSLATEVRDRGGFQRSDVPFAEFKWANFFRTRVKMGANGGDFEKAVVSALALAHDPSARNLPGFIP